MSPQEIAVVIVAATLGVLVLLLLVYGRPRQAAQEAVPANFYRGDPDQVLEGPRLQKVQMWGVASAIFITGFLAVYFVYEPFRMQNFQESHFTASMRSSIERGEKIYSIGGDAECAACHGGQGEGGFSATDLTWPAPPLNNVMHRYPSTEVERIVRQGRDGTPMPPWAIEFGGPLNDQMLEDVINYLDSIQVEFDDRFEFPEELDDGQQVFAQACAVCHEADATGRAMGLPLPTFYAPDLTTSFYRMGVSVLQQDDPDLDPADVGFDEILEAGEAAVENTILSGRANTPMPPWRDRMHSHQVDALMEYLRGLQRQPG